MQSTLSIKFLTYLNLVGHFSQPGNVNQVVPPVQDGQSIPTNPQYLNNQYQNSYQCAAPYFGTCYVCGIFGHLGKNCSN